jgi:hypothetical protein
MVSTKGAKGNLPTKTGGALRYKTRSRVAQLPSRKNHLVPLPVGKLILHFSTNLGAKWVQTKELKFLKKCAVWFVDFLNETGSMFPTVFVLTSTN